MAKNCTFKGCGVALRNTKNLFCGTHEAHMRREMHRTGYLTPLPEATERRKTSQREDTAATKRGVDER